MKKIIVFAVVFLVGVAIVGSLAVRSTNAEQFFKGDKVKVTRTVNSAVVSERPWAGNLQIGTQPKDAMGIVTDGPQDLFGHHYYEVNFDTGVDGWVEDTDLGLVFREAPIPGSPSPSTKFQIGTVIAVSSSVGVSVNVRSEPKIVVTNVIGSHYGGDKGTVVDGPRSGDGYNWWFVSFNDAPDGWVAENLVEAVSPQPVPSTKFAINDRVGIPLGYGLKVRSYPYGEVVGTHQRGAQGVVMGGAIYAGQRYWWKINFDSGDDGWFEEGYLYKISGKFRAGDSVQVTVGPNQQIRVGSFRASSDLENYFVGYDGVLLGNHNDGESGSVTGGPKFYKDAWWWSVDYQNFPDGWSPESGLAFSGTLPPSAGGDFSLSKPVAGATYQRGVNLVVYWGALPVDNNWPVGLTVKLAGPYNDLNNTPTERTIITRGAEVDPRRGIPYYQAQSGWLISSDVKDGLYVVIAIANYSANGSDRTSISGAFTISGTAPPGGGTNQPPVITSVSGPISTTVGQPGSWTVLASDPEGGVLTYEVNWGDSSATSSQTGSVFSHTYASLGTYTIRATVKDTSGASGEGTLSVTVTGAGGQVSPTFAIGDRVIVIDYVPSVTANNCLTDPLSSGTFHGAISPRQLGTIVGGPSVYFGTEHPLWLVDYYGVSVAGSCWSWESSLKKLPPPANQPPVVDDFSSTQIFWEVNKDFDVDLSVSDPDGNLASYKIDWGDSQSTGPITISGTSTTKSESHKYTNTARNIIAKLTVTDALGLTATRNLAIHVVLGPCSTRFQTGDRVRVINAGSDREHGLLVRSTPEATSNIGAHIDGELGTIVGSPQLARGYCRWNVNYDSDPDGWSAEGSSNPVQYWLEKVSDGTSRVTPPGVTPPGVTPPGITPPGTPVPPVQPQPGPAGVTGTFSVTSPMAGETWRVGEIRSIKWTPPAGVSALDIYLGTGLIRIGAANVGQFDWVIPSSLNNQSIEGAGRQIVLNVPGGGQAASGQFSILSKQLGVGDTIQNIQTLNVKLSLNPDISGGVQYAYARGTIAQGPQLGPPQLLGGNKYWWVDYPTGADGWVLDDDLAKVVPLNLPPKIDRFEPNSPVFYVGIEDKLEVQATDPEGQTLNYKIDWGDGSSDNYTGASGQSVTISHAYTQAGPNKNISVTVSDGQLTDSKTLSVTVNQPSVVTNLPPNSLTITGPTSVTTGVVNTWQVKATDPEGLSLTYTVSWGDATSNSTYTGASGQSVNISHNYGQFGAATIQAGSKTITVKVSDGQLTDSKTLTVNVVTGSSSSQGPSSQISGPQTPVVGVPNSWQIVAYDPDSTSISFVVNWGDGISNNYSGPPGQQITATHTYSQPGQRTINVVASDGALTHGSSWGVSVLTPDRATQKPTLPIITGPTKVIVGTSNSWQVLIQDPDTNALSYTIDWGDGTSGSGNAQNGQTVTISHTYATVGFKTFMVIVSDGNSTESRTFSPTVVLDNQPPTISSLTGPVEIGTGVTGLWQITGSDPEAGALTYAVNWGGGGTNTYTGSSGQAVSGNHAYAQAGSFTIQVTATDNGGLTATKTFNTQTKVVTATAGSVKFKVNDSIEVMPDNSNLAMRALPKVGGYWIVGRNAVNRGGVRGVVVGGPVAADGYNWWEIKWNDNLIGWSAENWLQKYTASSGTQTSTIRVGQYAPLINHPDLPPKGNPQKLSTFSLNGRVWGWAAGDGLWKFTSGPDLTIQY